MVQYKELLLNTFTIQEEEGELLVRCRGCRELKEISSLPKSIPGTITIEGIEIPVVDIKAHFSGKPARRAIPAVF